MKKVKFEIIRDTDGIVDGYRLGNHYLMKHYYWMNDYEWIINTTGRNFYFQRDFDKAVASGEIEFVLTCKQGKQRLIELECM